MNAWKPILFVLALMAALPLTSEGASAPCKNSVGGTWAFGVAPKGCDPVTDFSKISARYAELIYHDNQNGERSRYTQAMYAFLRDAADYYLDQRRQNVTSDERVHWRRAVMAMANQESYWSQYRLVDADSPKFMRGDSGYGYGLVQVDERWHPQMALTNKAEDLVTNLMFGLDMFFQNWEKAAKVKCVSKGNFDQRARAAYSAYNGGPAKYCRWTKPKDKWARNDKGYWEKYHSQGWLKYVASTDARSPVDVECLVEGGGECGRGVGVEPAVYFITSVKPKPVQRLIPVIAKNKEWSLV